MNTQQACSRVWNQAKKLNHNTFLFLSSKVRESNGWRNIIKARSNVKQNLTNLKWYIKAKQKLNGISLKTDENVHYFLVFFSGSGWSPKVSPAATKQFWSYSISWSQLSDVWFLWQRKNWQDKMSIESPILCTPAFSHRLRSCPQQQKSVGIVPALPEALLPVVLNNWPLLAKGCQSSAQSSPRFILSLIVSASLSSVFVAHTLGAVSRLTQYCSLCSGSRLDLTEIVSVTSRFLYTSRAT